MRSFLPQSIIGRLARVVTLSPNGLAYIAIGVALLAGFYSLGRDRSGYSLISMIGNSVGAGMTGFGIDYYRRRAKKYFRLKQFVAKHGIHPVHVRLHQGTYCDRQIYKAVADSLGLNADYRRVCDEYRHDQQRNIRAKIDRFDRMFWEQAAGCPKGPAPQRHEERAQ